MSAVLVTLDLAHFAALDRIDAQNVVKQFRDDLCVVRWRIGPEHISDSVRAPNVPGLVGVKLSPAFPMPSAHGRWTVAIEHGDELTIDDTHFPACTVGNMREVLRWMDQLAADIGADRLRGAGGVCR